MLKIKISKDDAFEIKEFSGHQCFVGRQKSCDIQLLDPTISGTHCLFFIVNNRLFIKDLGSVNKFYINGFSETEAELEMNANVDIGPFQITVLDFSYDRELEKDKTVEFNRTIIDNIVEDNSVFTYVSETDGFDPFKTEITLENSDEILEETKYLDDHHECFIEIYSTIGEQIIDHFIFDSTKNKILVAEICPMFDFKDVLFEFKDNNWILNNQFNLNTVLPFKIFFRVKKDSKKLKVIPFPRLEKIFKQSSVSAAVFLILLIAITPWMLPEKEIEEEKVVAIIYQPLKKEEILKPIEKVASGGGVKGAESNAQKSKGTKVAKAFNNSGLMNALSRLTESPTGNLNIVKSGSNESSTAETLGVSTKSGRGLASIGGGSGGEGLGNGKGDLGVGEGLKGVSKSKGLHFGDSGSRTVLMGSIDPEEIRKILQRYLPQFRHCYQRELDKSRSTKGLIDLEFTINGEGKVAKTDIKAKEQGFTNDGVNCLSSILKVIQFPRPKGGGIVDVRQPLNFYSES